MMFQLLVAATVFCVALSSPATNSPLWSSFVRNPRWEAFKLKYHKIYESWEQHLVRQLMYESNMRFIDKHNEEASRGLHTFTVTENKFADMTNKEFVAIMNGYILTNELMNGNMFQAHGLRVEDLPTSIDWRTKGYVTEVKDQGACGSCWAFSTTGALEGQTFNKTQKLVSLSEQNLVDCSQKQGNKGCKGGLMEKAFTYIKENNGIDTEEYYPYKGKNGQCRFSATHVGATDTGYVDIQKGSEESLQMAVATIGPISVGMDAGQLSFQFYEKGIYKDKKCSSKKLDHGVLVVGYGSKGDNAGKGDKDFWIIKNSWGKDWGMKGYFEMARNDNNMCGVATKACYPTL